MNGPQKNISIVTTGDVSETSLSQPLLSPVTPRGHKINRNKTNSNRKYNYKNPQNRLSLPKQRKRGNLGSKATETPTWAYSP